MAWQLIFLCCFAVGNAEKLASKFLPIQSHRRSGNTHDLQLLYQVSWSLCWSYRFHFHIIISDAQGVKTASHSVLFPFCSSTKPVHSQYTTFHSTVTACPFSNRSVEVSRLCRLSGNPDKPSVIYFAPYNESSVLIVHSLARQYWGTWVLTTGENWQP